MVVPVRPLGIRHLTHDELPEETWSRMCSSCPSRASSSRSCLGGAIAYFSTESAVSETWVRAEKVREGGDELTYR